MSKAFAEFKEKLSLSPEDAGALYSDLEKYMSLSMHLDTIQDRVISKIMKMESLEEIKYVGEHALAGSTLDWLIKSRIDYLEGKPSEYELYLQSLLEKNMNLRSESEIKECIASLERNTEEIRGNMSGWKDKDVPIQMIRENSNRIHTLEWVLGKHDRWD